MRPSRSDQDKTTDSPLTAACRRAASSPPVEEPAQEQKAARLRHALADQLIEQGYLTDPAVEAAFRQVPRHRFAPEATLEAAYAAEDVAIITKRDPHGAAMSSISAPWLQALMLQEAALGPGDAALEIGSGGTNAALMQEIVGPEGRIVSVDIDPDIVERAHRLLPDAGYGSVTALIGDGEHGAPGHVPADGWDAIIVTVQAHDIPPAWIQQLAEGGRLVVPLLIHGYSWAIAFEKHNGHLLSTSFTVCGFVPMQGAGRREDTMLLLRGGEIRLRFPDGPAVDAGALEAALEMPRVERWTGTTLPGNTPFDTLLLWLATTLPGFCRLSVDEDRDTGIVQKPQGWDAAAIVRDGSLARLLTRKLHTDEETGISTWEFGVHGYGPQASALADTMAAAVAAWGRDLGPGIYPRIAAYPRDSDAHETPGTYRLDKQHARLAFSWA